MKSKLLEEMLFKNSSKIMKDEGILLFEKGKVNRLQGKRYKIFYSLYGEVDGYKTYTKINLKEKTVEKVSCTCKDYEELSKVKKTYICSHINASSYKFLISLNKISKQTREEREITKIIRKSSKDSYFYEGREEVGSYKVLIKEEDLRRKLFSLKKKVIKFTYDYLEVNSKINKKDMPLTFTIKEDKGNLVITTHKRLPIPLSQNLDVWFYKNEIYLPSLKQINAYKEIYKEIRDKGELTFPLNIERINSIFNILTNINGEIIIREEIRTLINAHTRGEFKLYKEGEEIYMEVYLSYGNLRFNILNDDDKHIIRDERFERVFLTKVYGVGFVKSGNRTEFIGGYIDKLQLLNGEDIGLKRLGKAVFITN